jgi:hypothetical protein
MRRLTAPEQRHELGIGVAQVEYPVQVSPTGSGIEPPHDLDLPARHAPPSMPE